MLKTPVAIIFFNRPEKLRKVFEVIKEVKPRQLFLICDGPRLSNQDDITNIEKCKKIVSDIDWECKVYKNYAETNLGCGLRPATGISWVFDQVNTAIILEDDCVPEKTFFNFCETNLNKYLNNTAVYMISGMNLLESYKTNTSYIFSKACTIGAWATWKRVWKKYDFEMKDYDNVTLKKTALNYLNFKNIKEEKKCAWDLTRDKIKHKEAINWWDYQFCFTVLSNEGLCIVPRRNLIKNIGFGSDATNVADEKDGIHFKLKTFPMEAELIHPKKIVYEENYDSKLVTIQNIKVNKIRVLLSKIKRFILRLGR